MGRHTTQWIRRRATSGAPSAPTVTGQTSTTITLSWSEVTGATGYVLQRSTAAAPDTWAATGYTGTATTYTDTVTTGAYYYRLQAVLASGSSAFSSAVLASTASEPAPPATPAAPEVGTVNATSAVLSWDAVAGAASYTLQRSATGAGTWANRTSDSSALTYTDTGLTASTGYDYRLQAVNADGASGYSPTVTVTTPAAATTPATPTAPTSSNITATSVDIAWAAVTGASTYTLQRALVTGGVVGTYSTIHNAAARTYDDAGLSASSTYRYRVSATNAAGTSAYSPTLTVITSATTTPTGGNVQPVSARYVVRRSGFRTAPHENGSTSVYKGANADEICRMAKDMGLSYVRGRFPGLNGGGVAEWVAALKKYNLGWLMTIVPEGGSTPAGQTTAETARKAREVRDTPDLVSVCVGIEGLNEPNHNKGGGEVPSNWAQIAHDHQVAFYEVCRPPSGAITTLSDKIMIGPSLQATFASNSYRGAGPWPGGPRHYHQVVEAGTLAYMDQAGLHTYPNGGLPEEGLDFRISNLRDAYGANYPVFVSEWGYSAAMNSTQGNPVTKAVSGVYVPRGFLQYVIGHDHNSPRRGHYFCLYEALDNWNPGLTDREAHFGAIGTNQSAIPAGLTEQERTAWLSSNPANWRNFFYQPAAESLKALLSPLQDPAGTAGYTPSRVELTITSSATNILWWAISTKAQSDAGTTTVYLVKDAAHNATASSVTVTDRVGARTVSVGGEVVRITTR